ncbi:GAF domain-containing sensor histidine kinase [Pedobacter sp. MC2016-24]|uniref:GAF domain-containing sensor histidine kinase n=1 Tax=Pedobacter sp. MC2016-24 TaxID=2780090 RepID=UPI001D161B9D|nr:GAF domain-containing sensor histidine kinase [Pedobacter sp. MC2016-24]
MQADLNAIAGIPVIYDILDSICKRTGMGFAAVARVTEEKWIACAVLDRISFGLVPGGELELKTTICHEIRLDEKIVVIDHVAEDPVYMHHHTPAQYGFQSYISVPIIQKDGRFFGTLCAIDPHPNQVNTTEVINMFKLYAELISFHLSAIEKIDAAENKLKEEQDNAELRDNFIAILGHDLRNPLGAISNSAQLLLRLPLDERGKKLANIIKDSSLRMNGLIENVLDFARGKLGGGIQLNIQSVSGLADLLTQVTTELQSVWPGRIIDLNLDLQSVVNCDQARIAQLFSNLLGNALTHSPDGTPVLVEATSGNGVFQLSVTNEGPHIDQSTLSRLFQPFFRNSVNSSKKGLGLGLYIASEIAKAHHGILNAESNDGKITFSLMFDCR